MFNVTLNAPQDSAFVELRDPRTQSLTGATIELAGPNSDTHRDAHEALRARRHALLRRYKSQEQVPNEEAAAAFRVYLADLTLGWQGLTEGMPPNEKALDYSRAAALKLYENPVVSEQVAAFLNDISGFIKG